MDQRMELHKDTESAILLIEMPFYTKQGHTLRF
jgi:hypothetical protein